jgi:hypothetical protein
MPVRDIKVVKVPLSNKERLPDYQPNFPPFPKLYLELLENKSKIKQNLINKEEPMNVGGLKRSEGNNDRGDIKETFKDDKKYKDDQEIHDKNSVRENSDSISISSSSRGDDKGKQFDDSISESDMGGNGSDESDSESYESRRGKRRSVSSSDDLSERLDELLKDDSGSEIGEEFKGDKGDKVRDKRDNPRDKSDRSVSSLSSSDESIRRSARDRDRNERGNERSVRSQDRVPGKFTPYKMPPPTLAELEAKGQIHRDKTMRDINHITTDEHEEEEKKRELKFKFHILKQSYPSAEDIPDFNMYSDLGSMQKEYDETVKRLSLDSSVNSYKTYLLMGFALTEFVLGNYLGFDMAGFTSQQKSKMHEYDKLLIELGERSYKPQGSSYPVELRLFGLIILNAGMFIFGKMLVRKTGQDILSVHQQPTQQQPFKPKRKLKGPTINVDDIPDLDQVK